MRKIGIASHKLQYSGGMERYIIDLVNGFSELGFDITCFARKFDKTLSEYAKIKPVALNTSWVPGKLRDQLFSKLLAKARKKIDVGTLISVTRNICSEVAICGGTHQGFLHYTRKKAKFSDKSQIALEQKFYQNARLIIAHSKLMAEELEYFYKVPNNKIKVLYPPVDTSRFFPAVSKEAVKKSLNLPLDKKVLLFPSSSHSRKGYDLLESYFSNCNLPIHLAVVGRPLPRRAKNIAYYGYHSNILPFYQASDFTIMASTYEPFGLVAIESILSGTPVVVSNRLGAGEIINEEAKSVFKAGSIIDLDKVIRKKLSSNCSVISCPKDNINFLIDYDFSLTTHCQKISDFIATI